MIIIYVGLGGFIGSCLRYLLTKILKQYFSSLPFGTLFSNVIAAMVIGFIIGWERQNTSLPENTKLFLTTGLLGGLSTFSTFSLETVTMFESGKYFLAGGNILLNVGLSLAFVLIGLFVAKMI